MISVMWVLTGVLLFLHLPFLMGLYQRKEPGSDEGEYRSSIATSEELSSRPSEELTEVLSLPPQIQSTTPNSLSIARCSLMYAKQLLNFAAPVNPSGKCGLPNAMPAGRIVVDWAKKDGLLYEYDVLDTPGLPTDPQEVNTMANETLLGYVCLPGSVAPVANVIRQYSFVEVAQDGTTECVGHFVQSFASTSGQQNMSVYDSSVATTARQLVYYQIYDQPSVMGIRYSCKQPNLQTGICDTPKVIVDIRKRPDQLTDAEKAALDRKINEVLARYCISTSTENFEKSTFRADLFPCNPPPSAPFTAFLQDLNAKYPAPQGNPPTCGRAANGMPHQPARQG